MCVSGRPWCCDARGSTIHHPQESQTTTPLGYQHLLPKDQLHVISVSDCSEHAHDYRS